MLGNNIKQVRLSKKMTQKHLAEMINSSQGYISDIENNFKSPKLNMILKIAEALEVLPQCLTFCEYELTKCKCKCSKTKYNKRKAPK